MRKKITISLYAMLAVCVGIFHSYAHYYTAYIEPFIWVAILILILLPLFWKEN